MSDGHLKKLLIESYADPEYSEAPKATFQAMFNPSTYTVKYGVEYDEEQGMGTTGLPQKFKASVPSEFSLDFTLDGTGASGPKEEVSDQVEKFLEVAYEYDSELHRPRYLKVAWGSLIFNSVFKGAQVKYTLFKPDGTPLRAVISATFFGFVEDKRRAAEERSASPDLVRRHVVRDGETLPLLAHRFYGNVGYYPALARFNELDVFARVETGTVLRMPPVAKAAR